jgi:DNA repair protein RecN (Recombination protein N)
VLCELRVENLLLIERAELTFAPGLNVLTGETGAGKTVLAHALDLLMGSPTHPANPARPRPTQPRPTQPGSSPSRRPRGAIVRPGAAEAYVEGVFSIPEAMRGEIAELLPESVRAGPAEPFEELILARRVGADGRSRAYLNGRGASVAHLRELGGRLISFYGQHEHRRLVLAGSQLQLLDEVCGARHAERLKACAGAYRKTRELESELERADELARAGERELDLLEHELAEIEAVAVSEEQHRSMLERRERLRHADALRAAAGAAAERLAPESCDDAGAAHLLATAAERLRAITGADARLGELGEMCARLAVEAQDLGGELRGYREALEADDDESLEALEERLAGVERAIRKYGGSIPSVEEHAERARVRREQMIAAGATRRRATESLALERGKLQKIASDLRTTRERAASKLAGAVREQLAALAMQDAGFQIALSETAVKANGGDAVQFMIAPNPGVPPGPLREIASGGELSRVMLALTSASAGGDDRAHAGDEGSKATLVFDEVDAGIGGHTARAVGERLQELARARQVLCITHLPQIASLAARHFSVRKDTSADPTLATVAQLDEPEVVGELVRMLGAGEHDDAARRHARDLRSAA